MITIWVFHLLIQDPVSNFHQPAAAGASRRRSNDTRAERLCPAHRHSMHRRSNCKHLGRNSTCSRLLNLIQSSVQSYARPQEGVEP